MTDKRIATRDGFGDPYNHGLRALAANDEQGWMVIGTANPFMGTQLWRTTVNTPDPMERFTDLNPFSWSYPGIAFCVKTGLMSGTSDTTFAPHAVTTRALTGIRLCPIRNDQADFSAFEPSGRPGIDQGLQIRAAAGNEDGQIHLCSHDVFSPAPGANSGSKRPPTVFPSITNNKNGTASGQNVPEMPQ